MKRFIYNVCLTLMVVVAFQAASTVAQITIRENVTEEPVLKPKQFDGMTNFIMQERPIDYKKYIGLKLFFVPKSDKYNSDRGERIINFLFSNDTVQVTKEGKIPFEDLSSTKLFGPPAQLKGAILEQYKRKKKRYEHIDKEQTTVYAPRFYYTSTNERNGEILGKIGTAPDSVSGKYFSILDIEGKAPFGLEGFQKLDEIELKPGRHQYLSLKVTLRNEENQDILYWIIDRANTIGDHFFLVPFFEKQREVYLNQNVVVKNPEHSPIVNYKFVDVNTGEAVRIREGEFWTCSDISFLATEDAYYMRCFYFLKNGDREIKIELGQRRGREFDWIQEYFVLEAEFRQQQLAKQQREEEVRRAAEEQKRKAEQERLARKREYIEKWGQEKGQMISDGKVLLGMNKEMCVAAWGNPINVNRTMISGLTNEQWIYGWGTYLYFDNGVLTAIQD